MIEENGTGANEYGNEKNFAVAFCKQQVKKLKEWVTKLITAEEAERKAADESLSNRIYNEATTRHNKYLEIKSGIETEEAERKAADAELDIEIANVKTDNNSCREDLCAEVNQRIAADEELHIEIQRVSEDVKTLVDNSVGDSGEFQKGIDAEAAERKEADAELKNEIDAAAGKLHDIIMAKSRGFEFGEVVSDYGKGWESTAEHEYENEKYGCLSVGDIISFKLTGIILNGNHTTSDSEVGLVTDYGCKTIIVSNANGFRVGHTYVAVMTDVWQDDNNLGEEHAKVVMDNGELTDIYNIQPIQTILDALNAGFNEPVKGNITADPRGYCDFSKQELNKPFLVYSYNQDVEDYGEDELLARGRINYDDEVGYKLSNITNIYHKHCYVFVKTKDVVAAIDGEDGEITVYKAEEYPILCKLYEMQTTLGTLSSELDAVNG